MIIVITLVALLLIYIVLKRFKVLKLPNVSLITGGVKTGKSALSLHLAIKQYNRNLRSYYINKYIYRREEEKPLFYSNIPLKVKNLVLLDKNVITRLNRINYKSVVFIDECSLLADSMSYKDTEINDRLLLFNKLFGHSTKGGYLFYNTQSIQDCHYAIKRCISNYVYIDHLQRLPFISIAHIRLMGYCGDNDSVVNVVENDEDTKYKKVIMFNSTFKKYDCYCYSILTDSLEVKNDVVCPDTLKTENILQFREMKGVKNER